MVMIACIYGGVCYSFFLPSFAFFLMVLRWFHALLWERLLLVLCRGAIAFIRFRVRTRSRLWSGFTVIG
ncbi:hypothetical protein BDQ94DRAFT_19820 [Aspergillus welwitschiae]|uniref:Uncharacterized protein n=1 Tax=Aspergillus welwitschiae TaxID=1341132 RepID=A0A3F3Q5Z3_9EURO|nr:hypothetical protein BDQ94DRAFT_19820 [Aspergillus welwitschiae]RDH34467.1 hypothetical protein BDQ94DRAFT_19820 [Aspergillus welwitschiae]